MIVFNYFKDKDKVRFILEGHADYKTNGFDPVCGMISVLAQSAIYGCQKHGSTAKIVRYVKGQVTIEASKHDDIALAIMDTCAEGIRQVIRNFPQCAREEGKHGYK